MTVKDKIKAVLSNTKANFKAGAALYSQFGDNESLKSVFEQKAKREKQEARIIDKLSYCLKKLLKELPDSVAPVLIDSFQEQIIIKTETVAPAYAKSSKRIPSNAPSQVHTLHERYIKLAREEAHLHSRLFPELNLSDEDCYKICLEIMNIKVSQDAIWDDIREWEQTGETPIITTTGFKDGAEAYKRLMNLRTRPKRLGKQIKAAIDETERAKYQATLDSVLEEIAYIEKQIEAN